MTVGNNRINNKGAFANFEELICKLSGTNMKYFKDLLAINHKLRIVGQLLKQHTQSSCKTNPSDA